MYILWLKKSVLVMFQNISKSVWVTFTFNFNIVYIFLFNKKEQVLRKGEFLGEKVFFGEIMYVMNKPRSHELFM